MGKSLREVMEVEIITGNRFVGFIDLMGFKDFVARNPHKTIHSELVSIFTQFKEKGLDESYYSDNIHYYVFSDSIVLFTYSDNKTEMMELLRLMRIFAERLYTASMPFRGAIAFGEMTLDTTNSIFFGQPLIDAYLLSEELSFYGITVHNTAEMLIQKDSWFAKRFILFNTPFKSGSSKHYVISPYIRFYNNLPISNITNNYRLKTAGALRKYVDNTEILHNACMLHQLQIEKSRKKPKSSSTKK